MTKSQWQDHFKSAIQNAESLYSKDSTNVSLLMFCLRSKLIPSADYLNWAKENFQLPVLSEQYFQVHKPQQELYKKWQKIHKWSCECMPIAEWDGVLIIACLELPENYQNVNPTTFVLASHEALDQAWEIYNKSERSASAASAGDFADMTALAATVVAPAKEAKSFIGDDGELILQDDAASEEASSESASDAEAASSEEESSGAPEGVELSGDGDENAGSPEGLFGDAPAPKMEPLGGPAQAAPVVLAKTETHLTKTEPIAQKPMNIEITKEINLDKMTPNLDAPTPPPPADVTAAMPKKGPRSVEPLLSIGEKTKIDNTPVSDELEEVADHEVQFPDKKQISPVANVAAGGDLPSAPVKPTMTTAGTAAYLLEKMRKQSQDQFDKEVLASFHQLKTFFKKSMLLAIGDKDRLVKPILWDGGFDIRKPATPEFNLKTPSIFKIVSGTQKPYHGYVVVNDLNESFFESWNHGQIPDHVTVVPLMDGDLVVGMIMGFGEKSSYNKNVLQFTENVAKGLTSKLLRGPQAKVA